MTIVGSKLGSNFVPPAYFSATVIAVVLILTAAMLLLFQWMSRILKEQTQNLMTVTNLVASKDLQTFQNLQWTTTQSLTNQSPNQSDADPIPVLDDQQMAFRLANKYREQGMDPSLAFAQTDDEFLSEFGGPDAFRTH
ncbi:hypothetical protein [Streptomyces griseosporeus]|uniref:hypothetical protein n=1 Tax=Streptomyces griseosporeus TaxID=1910 RepID=UPI00167D4A6A|nr:hypothetical protein [Streptomyces griseosporeus]